MRRWCLAVCCLIVLAVPARAHRLDEYLQATILSISPGTLTLTVRLVPGVAVAPAILANIDRNADGLLSKAEQQAYVERVMGDLSLREDDVPLPLKLTHIDFPQSAAMRSGTGEIVIDLSANLPGGNGRHHLSFTNSHQSGISVYLVNALQPQSGTLHIDTQERNRNQSSYQVWFVQGGSSEAASTRPNLDGFDPSFHLGMRHIAEGTDHLLFLLTLLLPAPLMACAGRWSERVTVRLGVLRILRIVTAFTLGHSLTLALGGFGLVQLPSRPVEVLIAVSIFISAVHAFRPIFPGRESVIAASFGLVHGLAFASSLTMVGITGWYRLVNLVGFNLGIESMQMLVVAAVLPVLLLLSRTRFYRAFRLAGACLAGLAALLWMFERITDRSIMVGSPLGILVRHGASTLTGLS